MSQTPNRDFVLADKRLRRKDDHTVDDPDWYTNQWDPGTFLGTVGGTADAGDLTVTITPLDTDRYPTPDPIVFTWTAETEEESAEGLYDQTVADLASVSGVPTVLSRYLKRAEYTAAGLVVQFVPQPNAPKFTVTMTGTGGTMTLTQSPIDTYPMTGISARQKANNVGASGEVWLSVVAVTSADDVLAIGSCTYSVQVLKVVERYDPVDQIERRPGVSDLGTLTGLALGEEVRVAVGGGRFIARLLTVASAPATTEYLEVRWRDVVT